MQHSEEAKIWVAAEEASCLQLCSEQPTEHGEPAAAAATAPSAGCWAASAAAAAGIQRDASAGCWPYLGRKASFRDTVDCILFLGGTDLAVAAAAEAVGVCSVGGWDEQRPCQGWAAGQELDQESTIEVTITQVASSETDISNAAEPYLREEQRCAWLETLWPFEPSSCYDLGQVALGSNGQGQHGTSLAESGWSTRRGGSGSAGWNCCYHGYNGLGRSDTLWEQNARNKPHEEGGQEWKLTWLLAGALTRMLWGAPDGPWVIELMTLRGRGRVRLPPALVEAPNEIETWALAGRPCRLVRPLMLWRLWRFWRLILGGRLEMLTLGGAACWLAIRWLPVGLRKPPSVWRKGYVLKTRHWMENEGGWKGLTCSWCGRGGGSRACKENWGRSREALKWVGAWNRPPGVPIACV